MLGRWGCEEAEPPSGDLYPGAFPAGLPPGTPRFTSLPGCPKPLSPTHGQPGSPQGRDERSGARCGEPALPKVVSVGQLLPGHPEPFPSFSGSLAPGALSLLPHRLAPEPFPSFPAAWLPEPFPSFLVDWFALGHLWVCSCACCASLFFRLSLSAALRQ